MVTRVSNTEKKMVFGTNIFKVSFVYQQGLLDRKPSRFLKNFTVFVRNFNFAYLKPKISQTLRSNLTHDINFIRFDYELRS